MIQNFFKVFLRIILLLVLSSVFSLVAAPFFASIYETITTSSLGGSFLDFTEVVGFLFSFLFSVSFFVGLTTNAVRYVMVVISVAIAVFFASLDIQNFYIPVVTVLIGAGLGWVVKKVISSFTKGS